MGQKGEFGGHGWLLTLDSEDKVPPDVRDDLICPLARYPESFMPIIFHKYDINGGSIRGYLKDVDRF